MLRTPPFFFPKMVAAKSGSEIDHGEFHFLFPAAIPTPDL
jgi:hypothetical protein